MSELLKYRYRAMLATRPHGRKDVELAYRPKTFYLGAGVSGFALLAMAWVLWAARRSGATP